MPTQCQEAQIARLDHLIGTVQAAFRRRAVLTAALWATAGALLMAAAAVAADAAWRLESLVCAATQISAALAGIAGVAIAVARARRRIPSAYYAAQLIEKARPELKNSLITFVELRSDPGSAPALCGAVGRRAARLLVNLDPLVVVPPLRLRRPVTALVLAAGLLGTGLWATGAIRLGPWIARAEASPPASSRGEVGAGAAAGRPSPTVTVTPGTGAGAAADAGAVAAAIRADAEKFDRLAQALGKGREPAAGAAGEPVGTSPAASAAGSPAAGGAGGGASAAGAEARREPSAGAAGEPVGRSPAASAAGSGAAGSGAAGAEARREPSAGAAGEPVGTSPAASAAGSGAAGSGAAGSGAAGSGAAGAGARREPAAGAAGEPVGRSPAASAAGSGAAGAGAEATGAGGTSTGGADTGGVGISPTAVGGGAPGAEDGGGKARRPARADGPPLVKRPQTADFPPQVLESMRQVRRLVDEADRRLRDGEVTDAFLGRMGMSNAEFRRFVAGWQRELEKAAPEAAAAGPATARSAAAGTGELLQGNTGGAAVAASAATPEPQVVEAGQARVSARLRPAVETYFKALGRLGAEPPNAKEGG